MNERRGGVHHFAPRHHRCLPAAERVGATRRPSSSGSTRSPTTRDCCLGRGILRLPAHPAPDRPGPREGRLDLRRGHRQHPDHGRRAHGNRRPLPRALGRVPLRRLRPAVPEGTRRPHGGRLDGTGALRLQLPGFQFRDRAAPRSPVGAASTPCRRPSPCSSGARRRETWRASPTTATSTPRRSATPAVRSGSSVSTTRPSSTARRSWPPTGWEPGSSRWGARARASSARTSPSSTSPPTWHCPPTVPFGSWRERETATTSSTSRAVRADRTTSAPASSAAVPSRSMAPPTG